MGVVHEVERIADGRHLAAKFVPQLSDKKSLLRFMREAQILARLRHPNLIGITDVDMTAGGILFMIMDLVVGGSLKSARKRFGEVRWALCVLRQIAEALAAIHETMTALHQAGIIDDETMRRFDKACLVPALPLKRKRSDPSPTPNTSARPSSPTT